MSTQIFKTTSVRCSLCHLKNICIPTRLVESEFAQLEHVIQKRAVFKRGEALLKSGDEFDSIYAVSSGSFKNEHISPDGTQQITNFFLPGEIIGLNAVGTNVHTTQTVALETSSVCEIKFTQLEEIMAELPNLHREVLALMSKEIRQEQCAVGIISHSGATERMASFLLNLSDRLNQRCLSGESFVLTMTRSDMGDYLGLATETVSRQLSSLAESGLIEIIGRNITILDKKALSELVTSD